MSAGDRHQLLELYKLHAELADHVSERREGANRLYVSVLAGIAAVLAVSIGFGVTGLPSGTMMLWTGIFGVLLSLKWLVAIHSYRRLNSGNFAVLHELETELAFQFFTKEWESLKEKGYRRLTVVETALPYVFVVLFMSLVVFSFTTDAGC